MIGIIFIISCLVRIWYTLKPTMVLWDTSIYIGMGKYIFSHGAIGVLEIFRPPVIPLILGIIWKVGIDPLITGKILATLASLALIHVVYSIARRISETAGILAASLLSFTAVFIAFTNAPLSDIPSTLFILLAVSLVLKKRYWIAGLMIALAFGMRFPQALAAFPLGFFVLLDSSDLTQILKKRILNACKLAGGFLILVIPYLILNFFMYHDPFLPIVWANRVASDPINAHGYDFFFYTRNLLIQNPFLIISIFTLIPLFILLKKIWRNKSDMTGKILTETERVVLISWLSLSIIGTYFNFNAHLETRYAIAFLPFLCILSAYGITRLIGLLPARYTSKANTGSIVMVTCFLLFVCWFGYVKYWPMYSSTPDLESFFSYFKDKPGATVITSSPQMISYSDITTVQAIDTWENATNAFAVSNSNAEYFAVDNCALVCENSSCDVLEKNLYKNLAATRTLVFDKKTLGCNLQIYK